MGGGLGTSASERRGLEEEVGRTNTLSGVSGAYGGLLSAPYVARLMILEIARPNAARFSDTLVAGLLASSVAFAVYFPIARVYVRRDPHAAVFQVRGLAVACRDSPRPRCRGTRADHCRRDRAVHEADRSARGPDDLFARLSEERSLGWSAWRCR